MTDLPSGDLFTRRVILRLKGMEKVIVRRDAAYGPADGGLSMDIYYPRGQTDAGGWPPVIIVSGYPGMKKARPTTFAYKDIGWTVSICQLIAMSGMAAVAYTNRDPVADLQALVEHLHDDADSLRIDPARIGVMAVSGNVPTALATSSRICQSPSSTMSKGRTPSICSTTAAPRATSCARRCSFCCST